MTAVRYRGAYDDPGTIVDGDDAPLPEADVVIDDHVELLGVLGPGLTPAGRRSTMGQGADGRDTDAQGLRGRGDGGDPWPSRPAR